MREQGILMSIHMGGHDAAVAKQLGSFMAHLLGMILQDQLRVGLNCCH
jgi:hypothetical protein